MKLRLIITTFISLLITTATVYATHITIDGIVTGGQWTVANCFDDAEGANDISGQRDLTTSCIESTDYPTSINVYWAWDDIQFNGANTGDACILFDTDFDGNANRALCASVLGNPPVLTTVRLFNCPSDDSAVNCGGFTAITGFASNCAVALNDINPFDTTLDTVAECNILMSDVGGGAAATVDICSYPSASSPSAAADCLNVPPLSPTAVHFKDLSVTIASIRPYIALTLISFLTVTSFVLLYRRQRINHL